MDRTMTYPGALPQDTDILQPQRNAMVALGFALKAAFGTTTVADGLACTQTTVASLSFLVGPGSVTQNSVVDASAYGSIAADTTDNLVKMGVNLTTTTLGPLTAPTTAGQSQNFLVEGEMVETDTGATVLPYYNAANPAAPYAGPGNSGTSQNTARTQTVNLQIKAGSAATTGSQTTPAPDTGFVGLWVITLAHGQTTITSSNIARYPGSLWVDAAGVGRGMQPGRLLNVQNFTSTGTYTPTPGTNGIVVEVIGGGGGGGGYNATGAGQYAAGAAGASGSYCKALIPSGFASGVTVTVGAAGTAGKGSTAGTSGGTSSFGTFVSCPGGTPGGSFGPAGSGSNGSATDGAGGGGPSVSGATSIVADAGRVPSTYAFVIGGSISLAGHAAETTLSPFGKGGFGGNAGPSSAAAFGGAGTAGTVVVWEYS